MARTVEPFPTSCAREPTACGGSARKASGAECGCPTGEPGRTGPIAARTVQPFAKADAPVQPKARVVTTGTPTSTPGRRVTPFSAAPALVPARDAIQHTDRNIASGVGARTVTLFNSGPRTVAPGASTPAPVVLDVRSAAEFATGHVQGAVNAPHGMNPRLLARLGARNTPIIVYCETGRRSEVAAKELAEWGFTSVVDAQRPDDAAAISGRAFSTSALGGNGARAVTQVVSTPTVARAKDGGWPTPAGPHDEPPRRQEKPRPCDEGPRPPSKDEIPRPRSEKAPGPIRRGCTIRLAAEMAADRKGGHWWLRSGGCERFESWLAYTLDIFATSRRVLEHDTYRRVRQMNPEFVGLIGCMPTGLHLGRYLRIPGPEINELRDTGGFLVTDAPLSAWAIEVDNGWRLGPRVVGRDDTLPYLPYFNQSSGKGMILAPNSGQRPDGFPANETLRITCHPTVFAVDPSRAAGVMAEAILATCREYGADGVRLDEMTVEYQWLVSDERRLGEPPAIPNDLVRLDSPVLTDCNPAESHAGPLANRRTQAVKFGDGHFSLSPYTRFHPEVCGGRNTRAGEVPNPMLGWATESENACRISLDHALMEMLGEVSRLLLEGSKGGRPVELWPNMNPTLFSAWRNIQKLSPVQLFAEAPFDERYGTGLGGVDAALNGGGWFEKFCQEPISESPVFPVVTVPSVVGPNVIAIDAADRRVSVRGPDGDETLCIYRVRPDGSESWRGHVKWAIETARRGGPTRVDTGFTSLDDLQFGLASYLLCRAVPVGAASDPLEWPAIERRGPAIGRGYPAPNRNLAIFPRYIHPLGAVHLECALAGPIPQRGCQWDCVEHASELPPDSIPPQVANGTHPLVLQSVLGGPSAATNGRELHTPLRLLLDVELGQALGFGWDGRVAVAYFEHGQVMVFPLTVENPASDQTPPLRYFPRLPAGRIGLYLTVDVTAINALVADPSWPFVALEKLPNWAITEPRQASLVRAMEAGIGAVPLPTICARRLSEATSPIMLFPGTGRVLVYEDSPAGRTWRRMFSTLLPSPERYVMRTVDDWVEEFRSSHPTFGHGQGDVRDRARLAAGVGKW